MAFDTSYILNPKIPVEMTSSNIPFKRMIRQTSPLTLIQTPTYDNTGEATHPSVIYVRRAPNGKRWWMAMTPYYNTDIKLENPSILCSDDGINWTEPAKGINPLVPAPESGFNADTTLVYDDSENKFYLYYAHFNGNVEKKYVLTSSNGVNWSAPQEVFGFNSTAVVKTRGGNFLAFSPQGNKYTSADGINWKETSRMVGTEKLRGSKGHLTVYHDSSGYHFLQSSRPENTDQRHQLFYGFSKDGDVIEWDYNPLVHPELGTWYGDRVYTSCFTPNDKNGLRVYVSAIGSKGSRIGIMDVITEIDSVTTVREVDPDGTYIRLADTVTIAANSSWDYNKMIDVRKFKDYAFYISCTQNHKLVGYVTPDGTTLSPGQTLVDGLTATPEKRPKPALVPSPFKLTYGLRPQIFNTGSADAILDMWLFIVK